MTKFYYPFRLSWRQLAFNKLRFLTAIVGVIFACVLVFMQLGFKDGLFDSATLLQRTLTGDLYIVHDQSEAIWRLVPFPRQRLYRVLSIPEIKSVTPLYVGQAPWKNPLNGINRTTLVFGINPDSEVYTIDGLTRENRDKLKIHGNILFDELSRPEFGPVQEMLLKGPFKVELNGMKVNVVGTYRMGITFSADGNLITNESTLFSLFPQKSQGSTDIGIIKLKPGANLLKVQSEVRKVLPSDVKILTKSEYIEDEKAYWNNIAPIGYIFNFGVIMGLVVGFVVVYQVLFNEITNHLHEYATLKAIGYTNNYFVLVVLSSSSILCFFGFVPGFLLSVYLYGVAENGTFIAMNMNIDKVIYVGFLILLMCFASALFAIQKLRSADPVDVLK